MIQAFYSWVNAMEFSVNELRKRNRELRAGLDAELLDLAGRKLGERICLLPEYEQAERIAAYFAVNGEISLDTVIDHALARGKQIFLPNLDQKTLRFSPYSRDQKMRMNKFKLPEPDVGDDEMLAPEALDLVLAPAHDQSQCRARCGIA